MKKLVVKSNSLLLAPVLLVVVWASGCKESTEPTDTLRTSGPTAPSETREIRRLPPVSKEGMRRRYNSGVFTFNLRGDMGLYPMNVSDWVEYQLSDGRQAVAILDAHTETWLVIEYLSLIHI